MSEQPNEPFNLGRFLQAQEPSYPQALAELQTGQKRSHWSWYILPQVQGLGSSAMSVRYAISSLDEAKAYLAHPVLGARLRECAAAMNSHTGLSAEQILGAIDARKFHSCLTLFIEASGNCEPVLAEALRKYFSGRPDPSTLSILASAQQGPA
jgi:uncharacterized protein (DUF1810 family)